MNITEALDYIHSVTWMGSRPGLSRTKELLEKMGNPQNGLRFVHVAGTNGKGSTCALCAAALKEAGYTVGLYTSPYIERFNERMKVNGVDISDAELAEITEFVKPFAESMKDHPTEFELVTAVGFEFFKRKKCDLVVLEVGLGGELDSTNVIEDPLVSVITEIALDHTRVLGDTVDEIASAKAGIIKKSCPVVSSDNDAKAAAVISARCKALGCRKLTPDFNSLKNKSCDINGIHFMYNNTEFTVPLCGTYQFRNAATAITVLEALGEQGYPVSLQAMAAGFKNVSWKARFEILSKNPLFIYDGGHNPQGVRAAVDSYKEHFGDAKPVVLVGVMADKDYTAEMKMLTELTDSFVTVLPDNPRALYPSKLATTIRGLGAKATPRLDMEKAVRLALKKANTKGGVFALGSLYMYSEVKNTFFKIIAENQDLFSRI